MFAGVENLFCSPVVGSCLLLVTTSVTWSEARNHCHSLRMDLASIENAVAGNFTAEVHSYVAGKLNSGLLVREFYHS